MKKTLIFLCSIVFFTNSLFAKPINKDISGLEFAAQMGFGWNLGNTLDALHGNGVDSEKGWGQPVTTKEMIDGLAASGIKTIRIPVSWRNHITDVKNYTIDPQWMARVKTIVDWAIDDGMFVVLNCHHDNLENAKEFAPGKGYYPLKKYQEESEKFLRAIWFQISKTFNDGYDEHLVFETLNEPRLIGHEHEWSYEKTCKSCKEAMDVLNHFNQTIVDVIRSSGGNNAVRFIGVPSLSCGVDPLLAQDFVLPTDPSSRIMAAVHMYSPYPFAMDPNPKINKFTDAHKADLERTFTKLYTKFCTKNIPVYIGEMGATNKENLKERELWFKYFVSHAMEKGIPCMLWDNGGYDASSKDYSEKYGFYCRPQKKWYFPTLIRIAVMAAGTRPGLIEEYDSNYSYGFNKVTAIPLLDKPFDTESWSKSVLIKKELLRDVKEGSIICIETAPSKSKDKSYKSLSFRDKDWVSLKPFTGTVNGDGSIYNETVNPKSDNSIYYWVLSDSDAKQINSNRDILLCGNDVKIISISVQY